MRETGLRPAGVEDFVPLLSLFIFRPRSGGFGEKALKSAHSRSFPPAGGAAGTLDWGTG